MAQAILTAAGIRKAYGPVVALDGVTYSAEAGKITCLLGDNGAAQHGEIVVGEDVETGHHIHQVPDVLDQAVAEHQRLLFSSSRKRSPTRSTASPRRR